MCVIVLPAVLIFAEGGKVVVLIVTTKFGTYCIPLA
jgi:hypothetical protein